MEVYASDGSQQNQVLLTTGAIPRRGGGLLQQHHFVLSTRISAPTVGVTALYAFPRATDVCSAGTLCVHVYPFYTSSVS